MRWLATTIIALGTLAGASATPVLAAAAPGPGAKTAIPDTSQVEKVGRWGHHGFGGGFGGLYIGPGSAYYGGGYYGGPYYGRPYYGYSDDYFDDDYYDYGRTYYYPSYRYRSWGHRRGHRHHRRWR